tara:strand:+ start:353 stop:586 length:234 start_codon:yes stop_codon:yes gene_type:complete
MIWKVIGVAFIANLAFIGWLLYTAPLMPDDFELKDEDIWPADEWPDNIYDEKDEDWPEPNDSLKEEAKNFKNANKEN